MSKQPSLNKAAQATASADLIVKNLRLLDLDEDFDWPQINSKTFAANDSIKNLSKRAYAAAWILYKLLVCIEPKDAQSSLGAFFPPFEPKQSNLLRAGAFKRLNDLKNEGFFGKEVTIHRTLFNDCKGSKFEELLAVFSTAVVLKIVEADQNDRSITRELLLEHRFSVESSASVLLAYRASFSRQLREREALGRRWQKFGRLLDSKAHELDRRASAMEETVSSMSIKRIPKRTLDRLGKHLTENWKGDSQWIEIVLQSDKHRLQNTLLERSFPNIWAHASSDTLYAICPEKNDSLLQSLEQRVSQQRARIDGWRSIHDRLVGQSRTTLGRASMKGSDNKHLNQFDTEDTASTPVRQNARIRGNSQSPIEADLHEQNTVRRKPGHIRSQSEFNNSPLNARRYGDNMGQRLANTGARLTRPLQRSESLLAKNQSSTRNSLSYENTTQELQVSSPSIPPQVCVTPQYGNESSPVDYFQGRTTDSDLATDIVTSVLNAQPSPTKPLATLAERTRMSMANSHPLNTEQLIKTPSDGGSKLPPEVPYSTRSESIPQTHLLLNDLADRTRQSMSTAAFSARGIENRRPSKVRPSGFNAAHQFTTPTKRALDSEQFSTPIFDETDLQADYETIFKSRPRVALSPTLTPMTENRESVGTALEMDNRTSYEDDFS